ncbi:hypothetical protein K438DRAFT_1982199 [Mycena galopus ATCC 62051]|nr:hypothetical protein K438DRAFT_1982199 [Mycena galopus ATCC 62051]
MSPRLLPAQHPVHKYVSLVAIATVGTLPRTVVTIDDFSKPPCQAANSRPNVAGTTNHIGLVRIPPRCSHDSQEF